jgi:peptidoglycan/xylan/chitin deacetylase (PgdA/CDA1 family)
MRGTIFACCLLVLADGSAVATECPDHPDAIGTSRTLVVDPTEHPLIRAFDYLESLPLEDHEVVLTFDDGPLPPYTGRMLDILASECVKVSFFMVGQMARAYPDLVKRVYAEGHTIGTHSENHPFTFARMAVEKAAREIEDGFDSVRSALGDPKGVSDFFRIPGLVRQDSVELYLTARVIRPGALILSRTTGDISTTRKLCGAPSAASKRAARASFCCTTSTR